jgi:hypothetical protein
MENIILGDQRLESLANGFAAMTLFRLIVHALLKLVESGGFKGTASQLLQKLESIAVEQGLIIHI